MNKFEFWYWQIIFFLGSVAGMLLYKYFKGELDWLL